MTDPIADALFSKSQAAVLGLLYGHPDESYYLRQIVQMTGLGLGHGQRELERLAAGGIIERTIQGRHVYFRANPKCPIFDELRSLITKTLGPVGLLRAAMTSLTAEIRCAFIFGSVARGEEAQASDLDLMVIGDTSLQRVVGAIHDVEVRLRRPINPIVYPPAEFRATLRAGNHFLRTVVAGEKLFVIGDADELGTLSSQRLDSRAQDVARRD
jgi:predicted nucleotidyltransferase